MQLYCSIVNANEQELTHNRVLIFQLDLSYLVEFELLEIIHSI